MSPNNLKRTLESDQQEEDSNIKKLRNDPESDEENTDDLEDEEDDDEDDEKAEDEENYQKRMDYVILTPPYQSSKHLTSSICDVHNCDNSNSLQCKKWFCDTSIIFKDSTLPSQHIFMKRIIFPLPKRTPLRADFSPKSTFWVNTRILAAIGIDINNQFLFAL